MINPYAAPNTETALEQATLGHESSVGDVTLRFGRWLLICGTCGGTSFVWGLAVTEHPLEIPAMVLGIVLYAAVYTLLDLQVLQPRMAASRLLRRAIGIGFAIRILASLIFPVGMMIDAVPGILSVSATQFLLGVDDTTQLFNVAGILLATLLQGLLLNGILWSLVLIIYGILLLIGVSRRDAEAEALAS